MYEKIIVEESGDSTIHQPPFFAVSLLKLAVMSLCTLSLYELYWFYKNWCRVRDREKVELSPMLRAVIFPYFFCPSLFYRIKNFAGSELVKSSLPAGPLAAGWVIVSILGGLPAPVGLISFLSVFILLPVQNAANKVNSVVSPGHDRNSQFTNENILAIAIGVSFSIAILYWTLK